MTKGFFRFSFASIIYQVITLLFIAFGIYHSFILTRGIINELAQGKYKNGSIFVTIFCYLGTLSAIYVELTFLIGNICLNTNNICISGDINFRREKIQYTAKINYVDIDNIEIIPSRKNSKGQPSSLSRPIPYLILTDKKGKKHRFGLYFMSKKTVKSLLNELLKKCMEVKGIEFDVEKLVKDFSSARWAVK